MSGSDAHASPSALRRGVGIAALVLAALAISAVSIAAGRWQWSRHEARSEALHAYEAAAGEPAAPLAVLIPAAAVALPPGSEWRIATASGVFDADSLTLLRNRAIEGARVSEYLAWFDVDGGGALLVLVGWAPLAEGAAIPVLPAGRVDIIVTLRNQEPDDGKRGDGATRIVGEQMPPSTQLPLPGYGVLRGECAAACEANFGRRVPDPELTLGPHLAYTVQWYALAVLAPLGVTAMLARGRGEPRPSEPAPPRRRRRAPARSDEEIEDAL